MRDILKIGDGFKILDTLQKSTDRFRFTNKLNVIDLGLRLEDVNDQALESEPVCHKGDRTKGLRTMRYNRFNITQDEISFLENDRVELNAFGSAELVAAR